MSRPRFRRLARAGPAVAAALLVWLPGATLATDVRFARDESRAFEIDGNPSAHYGVFASSDGSSYLVDLPSNQGVVLIDPVARVAVALAAQDVTRQADGSIRVNDRFSWSSVRYAVAVRGTTWRFRTEKSSVVVKRARAADAGDAPADIDAAADTAVAATATASSSARPPSSTPSGDGSTAAPAPTAPSGRPAPVECVSLVTRPASGVPGCTQAVFLRNACKAPVLATLQRTEHLMTGPLPQIFSQAVEQGEQWLGCSWWSGAMAPAQHTIVGASFLDGPAPSGRDRRR